MGMPHKGYSEALHALQSAEQPPKLIVFDLDYTLWPFWCEMYTVSDEPSLYPDSRGILEACRDVGIPMAVASRTPTPRVAEAFMRKLGMTDMFDNIQLIPASSGVDHHSAQKDKAHFPRIQKELKLPYKSMLFFDDETGNVTKVSRLGVTSVLVSSGMTAAMFQRGLEEHDRKLGS